MRTKRLGRRNNGKKRKLSTTVGWHAMPMETPKKITNETPTNTLALSPDQPRCRYRKRQQQKRMKCMELELALSSQADTTALNFHIGFFFFSSVVLLLIFFPALIYLLDLSRCADFLLRVRSLFAARKTQNTIISVCVIRR